MTAAAAAVAIVGLVLMVCYLQGFARALDTGPCDVPPAWVFGLGLLFFCGGIWWGLS